MDDDIQKIVGKNSGNNWNYKWLCQWGPDFGVCPRVILCGSPPANGKYTVLTGPSLLARPLNLVQKVWKYGT